MEAWRAKVTPQAYTESIRATLAQTSVEFQGPYSSLQKCEGKEETQKEATGILDEIVLNFESVIWFSFSTWPVIFVFPPEENMVFTIIISHLYYPS